TVVGPEAPLVAGVVDRFRAAGLAVVGPTAEAAQLEGSKAFSKDFMIRAGVPTARYRVVETMEAARAALDEFGFPVVLKADGLAAGKGVVIAADRAEAEEALPRLMGSRLVIEEFLAGEEVSYIVLSDGRNFIPFAPTQDHKNIFDGDKGPNTGGMGAYRDDRILTAEQAAAVDSQVIAPVLAQMAAEGRPFTGFLYAGLMMTPTGVRVLEFNVRMGDPETQPLMHGLQSDLAQILLAAAHGDLSGAARFEWAGGSSVCVVLAAQGYPGTVRTGDMIRGIEAADALGATVFHAGTAEGPDGLLTAGGRVLGVTASGPDLAQAIQSAYDAAKWVRFAGMQYRTDIGAKGLRRY
ncbi:MAG: phosphoribosylamine--glycine ligase, partial [Bryobacteraceae bacterium]|nr:phosphoribosylamine--glycine ligase [Bryobacteraceae bacterium]